MSDGERTIGFGRLTIGGEPLVAEGSWVLTEKHGDAVTSFIVMNSFEARRLGHQIMQRLDEDE